MKLLPTYLPFVLAALLVPAGGWAQADKDKDKKKDEKPATELDKDRKLLEELDFIDETEVKDESVKTGLEELLETVVVTATKQKQTIAAAPAIISVVTATQIKRMGYRTVAEALQSMPGIYLISDHVEWNAGIRGVNGGQRAGSRIMKVMIDGQPTAFRPSTANWLGEELIPIDAVSRIEVVRGPASALYGANAFLGVVNIITKSGALIDGASLTGRVGAVENHPSGGGSLVAGKKTGNAEILVAGSGSFTDRSGLTIANVPDGTAYSGPYDRSKDDTAVPASLFMKLFYQSPIFGGVSLDVSYQRLHARGEFMDWWPLTSGGDPSGMASARVPHLYNQVSLENLYVRTRVSRTFLEDFALALSGAFATMGPTSDDHLATADPTHPTYFTRDFGTTGVDLVGEFTWTLKDINAFTVGADYTLDWHNLQTYWGHALDDPLYGHRVTPNDKQELGTKRFYNIGAYGQAVVYPFVLAGSKLLETLGFTLGVRYDHHNIYGDAVNYRAGGVFLWRKLSTKVLFGTSFKAPAALQLYSGRLTAYDMDPNPDLKPETARTVEVQVGGEALPGLNGTITWFYSNIEDKVELVIDPTATTTRVKAQNVSAIASTGVELDTSYTWRDLTSFLSVSYQKSSQERTDPITNDTISRDTTLYPAVMLKFGAAYQIPKIYLGASLEGQLITSRLASDPNAREYDPVEKLPYELGTYFTLDAALFSVDLKLLKDRETFLQFKVSNITGQEYLYPGFGSFGDFDIPALGRSFMFTLNQRM